MTMTMTKIEMLTNERNLITKQENDWAKRSAKPLNEKEQVPCELLAASARSNWSDQSSIKLRNRTKLNVVTCLLGFMTMTKTVADENFEIIVNVMKSLTKIGQLIIFNMAMTTTKTQHSDDDEN